MLASIFDSNAADASLKGQVRCRQLAMLGCSQIPGGLWVPISASDADMKASLRWVFPSCAHRVTKFISSFDHNPCLQCLHKASQSIEGQEAHAGSQNVKDGRHDSVQNMRPEQLRTHNVFLRSDLPVCISGTVIMHNGVTGPQQHIHVQEQGATCSFMWLLSMHS